MTITKHIIERCQSKDQAAYKQVYQAYAPYVYAIVKNYFPNQEEQKDMLQEVFSQIFLSIHRYDPAKGAFKSWISKITVNQCAMQLRKRSRLRIVFSIEEVEAVTTDSISTLEVLDRATLEQLLSSMPEGYRTVFLLSVVDGYSHKEISALLAIKVQTSRSQLARAIKWIKQHQQVQAKLLNMMGYGLQ